jgi:PAS domain-containing protein
MASMDERLVHKLIAEFYESSLSPEHWSDTLVQLANAFDGNAAGLSHIDFRNSAHSVSIQFGFSDSQVQDYLRHFSAIDPRWAAGKDRRTGNIQFDAHHISEAEMDRSAFYQEFLAPADMRYYISGLIENSTHRASALTIQRPRSAGPMTEREERSLALLMPHLQRALRFQQRLGTLHASETILSNILDRVSGGIVVLDGHGKPALMNRAAESLIGQQDGIANIGGNLTACRLAENDAFQKMIGGALMVATGRGIDPGRALRISRPSGKRPLVVWAAPVIPTLLSQFGFLGAHILLIITDPETTPGSQKQKRPCWRTWRMARRPKRSTSTSG